MRTGVLLVLIVTACAQAADEPPATVRERLSIEEAELVVAPAASGGSITAQRRSTGGWEAASIALAVRGGELAITADGRGAITIERAALEFAPIDVPRSVLGYPAQLTDVQLASVRPVAASAAWTSDDAASAAAELEFALSWSLTVDGHRTPLGAPPLPPLSVELQLGGDGATIRAAARAHADGIVWRWADLVKFEDLDLTLAATTVTP